MSRAKFSEICRFVHSRSDIRLLPVTKKSIIANILFSHISFSPRHHPTLEVKKNQSQFTVLHFAGEVPYETTNFVCSTVDCRACSTSCSRFSCEEDMIFLANALLVGQKRIPIRHGAFALESSKFTSTRFLAAKSTASVIFFDAEP